MCIFTSDEVGNKVQYNTIQFKMYAKQYKKRMQVA